MPDISFHGFDTISQVCLRRSAGGGAAKGQQVVVDLVKFIHDQRRSVFHIFKPDVKCRWWVAMVFLFVPDDSLGKRGGASQILKILFVMDPRMINEHVNGMEIDIIFLQPGRGQEYTQK